MMIEQKIAYFVDFKGNIFLINRNNYKMVLDIGCYNCKEKIYKQILDMCEYEE